MKTWMDVETRRKETRLSQAEMCRRAGISQSTVTKGVKNDTSPAARTLAKLEDVLRHAEIERQCMVISTHKEHMLDSTSIPAIKAMWDA